LLTISPGAHSGFGKYVPEVTLHGMYRDHQIISDIDGRGALQDESGQSLLAFGQAVSRHQ
jgi:hypothetical protein